MMVELISLSMLFSSREIKKKKQDKSTIPNGAETILTRCSGVTCGYYTGYRAWFHACHKTHYSNMISWQVQKAGSINANY